MNDSKRLRWAPTISVVVGLGLVLAACGLGGNDGTGRNSNAVQPGASSLDAGVAGDCVTQLRNELLALRVSPAEADRLARETCLGPSVTGDPDAGLEPEPPDLDGGFGFEPPDLDGGFGFEPPDLDGGFGFEPPDLDGGPGFGPIITDGGAGEDLLTCFLRVRAEAIAQSLTLVEYEARMQAQCLGGP